MSVVNDIQRLILGWGTPTDFSKLCDGIELTTQGSDSWVSTHFQLATRKLPECFDRLLV